MVTAAVSALGFFITVPFSGFFCVLVDGVFAAEVADHLFPRFCLFLSLLHSHRAHAVAVDEFTSEGRLCLGLGLVSLSLALARVKVLTLYTKLVSQARLLSFGL